MIKRIFIAIDISADVREKTAEYIQDLRKDFQDLRVGWERAGKLHLTLKFLGDVDENQINNLNFLKIIV